LKATSTWDRDTAPKTNTKTRKLKEESWPDGQHSPSTTTSSRVTLEHVYNSCIHPAVTYGSETWALTNQGKNKLAAAHKKMERNMLNITYWDRKTNVGKSKDKGYRRD